MLFAVRFQMIPDSYWNILCSLDLENEIVKKIQLIKRRRRLKSCIYVFNNVFN